VSVNTRFEVLIPYLKGQVQLPHFVDRAVGVLDAVGIPFAISSAVIQ
jgi:hypothetical protein